MSDEEISQLLWELTNERERQARKIIEIGSILESKNRYKIQQLEKRQQRLTKKLDQIYKIQNNRCRWLIPCACERIKLFML